MAVTVYRSDDVDAPVITGAAGNTGYIDTLTACLVTGYGSKVAAGWTKPYTTGSTIAAFRQGGGSQHYLHVDETAAQYPVLRGYRQMTSISTATAVGAFPSVGQLAGGIRPVKSYTTTAISRPWMIVADNKTFYFWIGYDKTDFSTPYSTSTDITAFGSLVSRVPGDTMNTFIIGRPAASTSANTTPFCNALSMTGTDVPGQYIASSYLQDGNSVSFSNPQSYPAMHASAGTAGSYYPDPVTGGMLLDYLRVSEGGTSFRLVRGRLPGVLNPLHPLPGTHLDVLTGRGTFEGTDLLVVYKGGTEGRVVFSLNDLHW